METDKKEIKVYVYLDKVYITITVIFIILALFIIPEQLLFYAFVIFILVVGSVYLYRNGLLSMDATINTITPDTNKPKKDNNPKEEVFHIANNIFTYNQSKEVCGAYNARLATYKEMEAAYKNGADWCTYGWSDNNNIFFPTQQQTVDRFSKIPGKEHACGHEGVNGGYIADENAKFGVNCYGIKPKATEADTILKSIMPQTPVNEQDIEMERKIAYWNNKKSELLLLPFNKNDWNESFLRV
jgi:hypothetical protein